MAPKWIETATDWQSKCAGVKERGAHLLRSGQWSDCEFLVGPNQELFKAHRLTLASASPTFEAMLFGSLAENNNTITVSDLQPDTFRVLLEYIYTDNLNLDSSEMASDLCYGAQKYLMPQLFEQCTLYLTSNLAPKNACITYEFAKLMEDNTLAEQCLDTIKSNAKEVINHESFLELKADTVVTIFNLDPLNIDSELDLLDAVKRYAAAQENNGKEQYEKTTKLAIREAIKKIRFLTIDSPTFAVIDFAGLLTDSEILAISSNIACSKTHRPMPADFSTSNLPRNGARSGLFNKHRAEAKFIATVNMAKNDPLVMDSFYLRNMSVLLLGRRRSPLFDICFFTDPLDDLVQFWSCFVEAEFKFLSNKVDIKPFYIKKNFELSYFQKDWCFCLSDFPNATVLLNSDKGYINDGVLTMEVYLKAKEVVAHNR